jgi:hypothetical protein
MGRKCITPLVCFPISHEKDTQTISPQKLNKSCEAIPYICLQEVQTDLSIDSNEWQTQIKITSNNGFDSGTQTEEFSNSFDNDFETNSCNDSTNKSIIDFKKKFKVFNYNIVLIWN